MTDFTNMTSYAGIPCHFIFKKRHLTHKKTAKETNQYHAKHSSKTGAKKKTLRCNAPEKSDITRDLQNDSEEMILQNI